MCMVCVCVPVFGIDLPYQPLLLIQYIHGGPGPVGACARQVYVHGAAVQDGLGRDVAVPGL